MSVLAQQILEHASLQGEGTPLTARTLLHLGNRAAVDQALSRLARRGKLMRPGQGVYVRPIESRFGLRAPAAEKVVAELARLRGETVASHGASAANRMGLTTQIPMRTTYLTSGRSRRLQLGAQNIELQHVPNWQLTHAGRPAGEVVRALAWAGRLQAAAVLARINKELSPEVRQELLAARGVLPSWMAQAISLELAA